MINIEQQEIGGRMNSDIQTIQSQRTMWSQLFLTHGNNDYIVKRFIEVQFTRHKMYPF